MAEPMTELFCLGPAPEPALLDELRRATRPVAMAAGPGLLRLSSLRVAPADLARARDLLRQAGLDSAALPARPHLADFAVAFFDMDSTLVADETLDEMARALGLGELCAEITARAMAGEIRDYPTSLRQRVAMLAGRPASVMDRIMAGLTLNPGIGELIPVLMGRGLSCWVVSSGFSVMTSALARRLGMSGAHSNVIGVSDGKFTGEVTGPGGGPILDAAGKASFVAETARRLGVASARTICCGDGSNDLLMIRQAGLGVGFRPKAVLRPACHVTLDHGGWERLLTLFADTGPELTPLPG